MRKAVIAGLLGLLPILAASGPVDVNSADAVTIARELNGVGESKARAIVEYREKYGRFATADDLMKVSGVGPQILRLNRENILTGQASGKPEAGKPDGKTPHP